MTPQQAYEHLCQMVFLDPDYVPTPGHSSFLLVQLSQPRGEDLALHTIIVDPAMPNQGTASDYLQLHAPQRMLLECADILNVTAENIAAVTTNAPFDAHMIEKSQNDKALLCRLIRFVSRQAAAQSLQEAQP